MKTPLERAQALAKRRGVKTRATTLPGVLAALRRTPRRAPALLPPSRASTILHRITVPALLEARAQSPRDRVRLIADCEPFRAAVRAALGRSVSALIGAVPHCYRGEARESYAVAARYGRAVVADWGRVICPTATRGHGSYEICPSPRCGFIIDARDLLAALPQRRGWRWGADHLGVYVTGPRVPDYHVGADELAAAVQSGTLREIVTSARANAAVRRKAHAALREAERRERASIAQARKLARAHGSLPVTTRDSQAVGNCLAGTLAWARQHGVPRDTATLADLVPHVADRRVRAVVLHVARNAS